MDDDGAKCPSCGRPYVEHLGLTGTCANLCKLAKLTAQMRAAQRIYLQERSKERLEVVKRFERDVDTCLSQILEIDVEAMS